MQHKSLFAALLCGALCLTACLKNEESPSVTQVRNAKAHELESIAELNKAQATATITLANAQAKLLEAEAKLTEANAKIAEAQAKKVDAETALLVVEAKLQEVYVQIANVELEGKIAELEALKAQYKAEIAAAEAAEAYWQGVKDQVATELEIEAAQLEAALVNAQAEVAEAAANYAALLDQIEEELAQEEREDLAELRDRIAALSNEYTEAAMQLLEMKGDLYEANVMKAGLEAGIIEYEDYKNEVTEKNNNEIARIQKMIDYLMTYQQMTSEEAKDLHVDAVTALATAYVEYAQASEAAADKLAEWQSMVNDYVYTYPTKFYQETTHVESETGAWGDYSLYDLAQYYATNARWDEEREGWIYEYEWEEQEGDLMVEKHEDLYAREDMKSKSFVYPALPEGIEEAPLYYESNQERTIFPLMVNKAGFQAIADNEVAALEENRAAWNETYDKWIALYQEFIDYYAVPVGQYNELYEAAAALEEETHQAFLDNYDAWRDAIKEWYKENGVENMLEIQETLDELTAAINEYVDIINSVDVDEINHQIALLEAEIEALTQYKNATYAEEGKYPDYLEDQTQVVKYNQYYEAKMKEIADKNVELEAALGDVADQQAKVDAAMTKVETKKAAYYAAERAYYADPTSTAKYDAYNEAWNAYNDAISEYNTENGTLEGLQATADGIQDDIDLLQEDADYYLQQRDYYQAKVDEPDIRIPECEEEIAALEQQIADYEQAVDDQADAVLALEEYWAEIYDFFLESESGKAVADAYDAYDTAYYDWRDANDALYDLVDLYSNKYENFYQFIELVVYGDLYYPYRNDDEYELDDFIEYFEDYPEDYVSTYYELTTYEDYGDWASYFFYQTNMSVVALSAASEIAAELIEEMKADKAEMNEIYDASVATWATVMELYDNVTATESVYTDAISNANNTWAEYIELFKVAVDKAIVLADAVANEAALDATVQAALNFEEGIAELEADIQTLKDEIATLENEIKTAQDAIAMFLDPSIALMEEQIDVLEQLVNSLKAELNEALAELNN